MPDIQRIVELVRRAPPERRAAILDRECGADADLRRRVEALLAAPEVPSLLSGPTEGAPSSSATPTLKTGSEHFASATESSSARIGPYKLLQPLGEGGFGTVWMAEQDKPVQRKVALKIIKLGMDTRAVIARFEQERQALAILDHPNIAKVFDAGATETGRPFFVMELCTGEPIDAFCDKNSLSIRERLELFEQVCHAVQHAHTKGLIHRDIKPSNILVSQQDGKPHAKVIDFGIAKATAAKLTEKTLFTEHKALIGTPEYMSPEQAEGSMDIDTRTDVYSLGVLLYELLTGTTPFSSKELRSAAYAEIQRIIREVEPHRPSTRLSHNTDTLASVAAHRHTEPRKLGTIIRGELDWIVMKALEKDRQRRYETANGLAMDIQRYLAGDAVLAAPPSTAYRVRKFVRRHRAQVAAAALVAVALTLGLAGTTWQAKVASGRAAAARKAEAEAKTARDAEKARADELKKVSDFQGEMLAQIDPTTAGVRLAEDIKDRYSAVLAKASVPDEDRTPQIDSFIGQFSRVNATDTALKLIDQAILRPAAEAIGKQFADQPTLAATLRHVLAMRYHDLGLDQAALDLERLALADRRRLLGEENPDTLASIGNVAVYLNALGKRAEAEPLYREALDKSRRVRGPDSDGTFTDMCNLGYFLLDLGKLDEAEPLLRESLEGRRRVMGEDHPDTHISMTDWGNLLRERGRLAEAEAQFRDVLARRRRVLGEDDLKSLSSLNDLGSILKYQGKLTEAITCFREVADRRRRINGEMHPATLATIQNLGTTLGQADQHAEAESLMREALDKQRRLLGPDHYSTLTTQGNFCVYLINRQKFADAEPLCRDTLDRRTRVLGENHPGTLIANNVMGLVLIRQGRLDEGEPYWRTAQSTSQRLYGADHPETLVYTHNLGGLAVDRKKPDEAERLFREVIDKGQAKLDAAHPTILSATRRLGGLLNDRKAFAESAELLSKAEPSARNDKTAPGARFLALHLKLLGTARAGLNQFAQAETNLLEAHAILVKARGESHQDTRDCAEALADFYTAWDKAEPAKGYDAKAAEWKAKAPPAPPPK